MESHLIAPAHYTHPIATVTSIVPTARAVRFGRFSDEIVSEGSYRTH